MAEMPADQAAHYPLPVYHFKVDIGDFPPIGFSEVSGIRKAYHTLIYRQGFSFLEGPQIKKFKFGGYSPITLKKGVMRSDARKKLYAWLNDLKGIKSISLSLLDADAKAVVTWKVEKALLVKLEAPTFDATSNDVSIESMEVLGNGISVKYHE